MKKLHKQSFTLVELLITMVVSVVILSGVILSLVHTLVLNEYNQGFSLAMNIARAKLEAQIANRSNFDAIASTAGTLSKSADGIDGLYRIDVTSPISPDLKDISVVVCWKARAGRIYGTCEMSGGVLTWSNPPPPYTSSPCTLITSIARR